MPFKNVKNIIYVVGSGARSVEKRDGSMWGGMHQGD
jgi:hypothetical protein